MRQAAKSMKDRAQSLHEQSLVIDGMGGYGFPFEDILAGDIHATDSTPRRHKRSHPPISMSYSLSPIQMLVWRGNPASLHGVYCPARRCPAESLCRYEQQPCGVNVIRSLAVKRARRVRMRNELRCARHVA